MAKFSPIGGYRNVINNSNRVLQTEWYNNVLTEAGNYLCSVKSDYRKVKQKNGKENLIIRLNRTMERKIVITYNY